MLDKLPESVSTAPSRIGIIESLAPIAVAQVAEQLPAFLERLSHAMFRLSDQTVRPNEASLSFAAYQHLNKNRTRLQRAATACLSAALIDEIALLEKSVAAAPAGAPGDVSLLTLEEIENNVLIHTISEAIELDNAAALVALNVRLSRLMMREEITIAQNPFRPSVFLSAMFGAWRKFDADGGTHRLALRLMQPEVFLDFGPILAALNAALIARGIVPDLADADRTTNQFRRPPVSAEAERRDLSLQNKLQRYLQKAADVFDGAGGKLAPPAKSKHVQVSTAAVAHADQDTQRVLFDYLAELQRKLSQPAQASGAPAFARTAATLRHIPRQAPPGSLSNEDEKTVELLAQIFDFVFSDEAISDDIKSLLSQLQIPLLQAALADKAFFFDEDHPARRLIDHLAQCGLGVGQEIDAEDPLYQMVENIVDRVQHDFDQQIGLYSDVTADFECFLVQQERATRRALKSTIATALREEKMRASREAAENDVRLRIETGEVAGFVEAFLESQWVGILALAHSVAARKPQALEKALHAMDDLIWSIRPKVSPDERKELVSKLPSLLSLINAWLNAVKWDGPERVTFFSNLAERHAAIVRTQSELSPRHQIELAVNVAQKASERRLSRRARELQDQPIDQFVHMVDSIEPGTWVEFTRQNGAKAAFRLAWISPMRSRFIFSNRHSDEPVSFTAEELAGALRDQRAVVLPNASVVTRALTAALSDIEVDI